MAILLATLGLLAVDAPARGWFVGVGLSAVHTPPQNFGGALSAHSGPQGLGLSLEGQVESRRFFAAATVLFAGEPTAVSGRVGWFMLDLPVTPYLAVGAGWLREVSEDGDSPPNIVGASGAAVLAEAGVAGPRNVHFLRAIGYVQILKPLFGAPSDPSHIPPSPKTCLMGGIRLLF